MPDIFSNSEFVVAYDKRNTIKLQLTNILFFYAKSFQKYAGNFWTHSRNFYQSENCQTHAVNFKTHAGNFEQSENFMSVDKK